MDSAMVGPLLPGTSDMLVQPQMPEEVDVAAVETITPKVRLPALFGSQLRSSTRLPPQVVLDFLAREDVADRNETIANKTEEQHGGWRIGQVLRKEEGTPGAMSHTVLHGVVVEVI
eukprot:COSAG02_NODE_9479_length_2204_cov_4.132870_3_plen_116_part_00